MIRTRSTLFCGLLTLGLLFAGMSAPASAATARPAASAGSAAVGSAKYTVPTGAVFVATSGKDTAAGTKSAPVKTVTQALKLVPTGGTIVLRAGSYNETVEIYKKVTIQNYPGEAVWLDGSIPVTGWVKDGSTWRKDGWKVRFDHSPTYTKGAKDRTDDWQMVNPAVPMAPYPDQVWTGATRLTQVASKKAVTSGKFYLDESTSKLYVGSDPTGGARASNLQYAINVRATGVTIRGIGIRRFATSVWQMGSVTLESPNATVENVLIAESATTGISVINSGATLTKLTVENNGMLGIHGNNADRITLTSVVARNNNTENFNTGPVASGMKITKSRGVKVTNSSFANNNGHGFWEDQSVYDSVLSGNNFTGNKGYGLFLEISAKAIVADSLILNNKREGLVVNNFSNAQIWNNTIVGNSRPIWLAQDDRTPTKNDAGVDKRVAWPDPEMTWKVDQVTLSNNVLGIQAAGNTMLCVEDYTYTRTAEQMHVTTNGNVYNRATATSPSWLSIWSRGSAGAYTFTTLNAMKSTTKQEARGREYTGASVVDSKGALSASVVSQASAIALPLPSAVAAAIGRPAGTAALGAWVDAAASTPTPTPTTPTPTPTPTPTTPTPKPSVTSATDTFNRTVAHGWGTAKRGGTWSVPKAASKRFA
ncbi:MAG: right-handed parallel beta-helix repeat-containing protein, partial [Propionicimonas sp.]|nr:right-handed parallel beta-helix repeat-containing protein [Propionicimonas sp.]